VRARRRAEGRVGVKLAKACSAACGPGLLRNGRAAASTEAFFGFGFAVAFATRRFGHVNGVGFCSVGRGCGPLSWKAELEPAHV